MTTIPIQPESDRGTLQAFEYYCDLIRSRGFKPYNHTELTNGNTTGPEHLLWMCEHCIPLVRDDTQRLNIGKHSRWLGFIQGCLIMHGWTTVNEERDRTRPWFNP